MSRARWYGTEMDRAIQSLDRAPAWRVWLWNPNRTTIGAVVRGESRSPRYDLTPWVIDASISENIAFENSEDASASSARLILRRDREATPIPIDFTTLVSGAPVRIYWGDSRVVERLWVPVFTGVIWGSPSYVERSAEEPDQRITVELADRSVLYSNRKVVSRHYVRGVDIGKAAVETAIEHCELDRREIRFGSLGYAIGHEQAQLVDIEVLSGLAQMLFVVGRRPKFDSEGFLSAADADLDKAPARVYTDDRFIVRAERNETGTAQNNSVRVLGIDSVQTKIVEREKRLAHGTLTAGFFQTEINHRIAFSEASGEAEGGRRARNTRAVFSSQTLGSLVFGDDPDWVPTIEADGETVFEGRIQAATGYDVALRSALIFQYVGFRTAMAQIDLEVPGNLQAYQQLELVTAGLIAAIFASLTELGTLDFEIYGEPFQLVLQQIASTAQLSGVATENIREIEFRNDWLYDREYMDGIAKELLRREIAKSWSYEIEMADDPLLEADDVIALGGANGTERHYIERIERRFGGNADGTMRVRTWRVG